MINTDQIKSVHTHSGLSWRSTPVSGVFEGVYWILASDEETPLLLFFLPVSVYLVPPGLT